MKAEAFSAHSGGAGFLPPADQLRGIPLPALLAWHGFATKPEGLSLRAKTDHHNLVVTGSRWYDNKIGTGGAGAIDLQMHLTGEDFSTACRTLAGEFQAGESAGLGIASPVLKPNDSERLPFPQLVAKYAARDDSQWLIGRSYLVETRRIEPAIVDELHAVGSIYANDHRPNPSLVFLHRTECGKVIGATLRDTKHESAFRPTLGNKLSGWFTVGNPREAQTVVAVESPIDALSYYTLFASRNDRLAVVSCSGSTVPEDLMFQAYDRRQSFIVAFDSDAAGERGWTKAWDSVVDWTGFKISSDCPRRKDWNADLVATVNQSVARQSQKSLSLRS